MSYLLQVKGKKHVLQLWPKRFLLPRHLQVFSFTEQGELLEEYPYIPRDCNYVGVVEGTGESEATVSTCMGGLRGILKIDAQRYQIEPLKASSTFEHVVYLLKEQAFHQHLCGLTRKEGEERVAPRDLTARLGDLTGIIRHQRYLELALIFDHERYLYSNSNLSEVTSDAILLTSIMDTYFQELHMRIQLGTLEVWTDQNKVEQRRVEHFPPKCRHVWFQIFSPLHSVFCGEKRKTEWLSGGVCVHLSCPGRVSSFSDPCQPQYFQSGSRLSLPTVPSPWPNSTTSLLYLTPVSSVCVSMY